MRPTPTSAHAARRDTAARPRQRGAAMVEFALVATLFLTLLLGIVDFGRVLFQWNAAAEATRLGARIAVVCDPNAQAIRARMRTMMLNQGLSDAQLSVTYSPAGCNAGSCTSVTVSIQGYQIPFISPLMGFVMPDVPPFSTTLPRESMDSAGGLNPVCS